MNRIWGSFLWCGFLTTLFYFSLSDQATPLAESAATTSPIAHFESLHRRGPLTLDAIDGTLSPTQEISHNVHGTTKEHTFSCDELILEKNQIAHLNGHVRLQDMQKERTLIADTATLDYQTQNFLLEGPIECIVDSVEIPDAPFYAPFKR